MKIFLLTISIILSLIVPSISQTQLPQVPYQKINYLGLDPLWHETSQDTTFVSNSLDGFNHFRPGYSNTLIYGDFLYTVLSINETYSVAYGSYLQCRNLTTGKLLWQHELSVRKTGNYEVIRLLEIDNDGNLLVIGQVKSNDSITEQGFTFQENMILFRRKYIPSTGDVLEYFQRNFDDKEAFLMTSSIVRRAKHSYLLREDEMLRYIGSVKINDTNYLRSVLLDNTGKKISEESLLKFKYTTYYFNLIQIAPDTFIQVEINYSDSTILFRHLSPDLQEYATYTTPKLKSRPELLEFVKLSADKKKILFEYIDSNDPFFNFVELLVYDTKANLIKRAALDNYNSNYFEVLKWEEDDKDFTVLKPDIVEDENDERVSIMNVSTYNDYDGESIINTFTSTDPKRYAVPYNTIPLNENNYLIQFGELRNASTNFRDIGAYAISQMLLDGKILFLPSSIDDVASESSTITLYPNPTRDDFTLTFDTEYTGTIQVYSMSGQLQLQKTVSHTITDQVDISTLDAGMYIIQCISSDHKRSPVSLKLVKM